MFNKAFPIWNEFNGTRNRYGIQYNPALKKPTTLISSKQIYNKPKSTVLFEYETPRRQGAQFDSVTNKQGMSIYKKQYETFLNGGVGTVDWNKTQLSYLVDDYEDKNYLQYITEAKAKGLTEDEIKKIIKPPKKYVVGTLGEAKMNMQSLKSFIDVAQKRSLVQNAQDQKVLSDAVNAVTASIKTQSKISETMTKLLSSNVSESKAVTAAVYALSGETKGIGTAIDALKNASSADMKNVANAIAALAGKPVESPEIKKLMTDLTGAVRSSIINQPTPTSTGPTSATPSQILLISTDITQIKDDIKVIKDSQTQESKNNLNSFTAVVDAIAENKTTLGEIKTTTGAIQTATTNISAETKQILDNTNLSKSEIDNIVTLLTDPNIQNSLPAIVDSYKNITFSKIDELTKLLKNLTDNKDRKADDLILSMYTLASGLQTGSMKNDEIKSRYAVIEQSIEELKASIPPSSENKISSLDLAIKGTSGKVNRLEEEIKKANKTLAEQKLTVVEQEQIKLTLVSLQKQIDGIKIAESKSPVDLSGSNIVLLPPGPPTAQPTDQNAQTPPDQSSSPVAPLPDEEEEEEEEEKQPLPAGATPAPEILTSSALVEYKKKQKLHETKLQNTPNKDIVYYMLFPEGTTKNYVAISLSQKVGSFLVLNQLLQIRQKGEIKENKEFNALLDELKMPRYDEIFKNSTDKNEDIFDLAEKLSIPGQATYVDLRNTKGRGESNRGKLLLKDSTGKIVGAGRKRIAKQKGEGKKKPISLLTKSINKNNSWIEHVRKYCDDHKCSWAVGLKEGKKTY